MKLFRAGAPLRYGCYIELYAVNYVLTLVIRSSVLYQLSYYFCQYNIERIQGSDMQQFVLMEKSKKTHNERKSFNLYCAEKPKM